MFVLGLPVTRLPVEPVKEIYTFNGQTGNGLTGKPHLNKIPFTPLIDALRVLK